MKINGTTVYPLNHKLYPGVSAVIIQAALENLKGVKAYLKDKKMWVKYSYVDDSKNNESYNRGGDVPDGVTLPMCLIGASQKLNGQGEALAQTILHQMLTNAKEKFGEGEGLPVVMGVVDQKYLKALVMKDGEYEVLYVINEGSKVQDFNDEPATTFYGIHKFLDFAIAETKLLLKAAKAKKLEQYGAELLNLNVKSWVLSK